MYEPDAYGSFQFYLPYALFRQTALFIPFEYLDYISVSACNQQVFAVRSYAEIPGMRRCMSVSDTGKFSIFVY